MVLVLGGQPLKTELGCLKSNFMKKKSHFENEIPEKNQLQSFCQLFFRQLGVVKPLENHEKGLIIKFRQKYTFYKHRCNLFL